MKQVKSVYPHLDLFKVTMDDPLPSTLADDTVFEEANDSTELEQDPKNDGFVLAQPIVETAITPLVSSPEAPQDVESLPTLVAQEPPSKDNANPPAHDVKDPLV